MKKGLKIFLFSGITVLALVAAYLYFNPKRALGIIIPEFQNIENVHITALTDTLKIDADVLLKNKSIFKLSIDSFIYHIQLDTLTLLSRSQSLHLKMLPSSEDTLRLPISLPFKRLSSEIKHLQKQDSVGITYDLRIVYSTWMGQVDLPFKKTKTVAVPVPPRLEIQKLDYKKHEKQVFYFDAYVKVINKGKLDLHLSDIHYDLHVKNKDITAQGEDLHEIHISPATETVIVLPVSVEFKHVLKTLVSVLVNDDKIDYQLKIRAMARMDKLSSKKTPVEIEKNGITELKK